MYATVFSSLPVGSHSFLLRGLTYCVLIFLGVSEQWCGCQYYLGFVTWLMHAGARSGYTNTVRVSLHWKLTGVGGGKRGVCVCLCVCVCVGGGGSSLLCRD